MRSLFPWTEVSKAVQKPNGGQEVPEIALSVGSKLELLRAFVFAKCPYTSPYTHAFVRVCVYILYTLYMTEAPRVLHFSAFIIKAVLRFDHMQKLTCFGPAAHSTKPVHKVSYQYNYAVTHSGEGVQWSYCGIITNRILTR